MKPKEKKFIIILLIILVFTLFYDVYNAGFSFAKIRESAEILTVVSGALIFAYAHRNST